jgi:crotonobetainyl-CoA:carnitine CoA-transferase CaiB-like acyl-CoA transferase
MVADVIKVESPSAWDNIRTLISQPGVADPWNSSYYFNAYNRDKRSLTLDLAQDEGRELMLRLLADADVLLENYRADVLDKLGLTADVLRTTNPNLVTISMAAFGKEGPDSKYVGFGPVIELMSGLSSLTGYVGDGEPFKTGISYCDPVAGLHAVAATVLGLAARDAGEGGRFIDLAQREGAMTLIGDAFVKASRGEEIVHYGCRDDRLAPQGAYPVRGVDAWIVVSVRDDDEWRSLCALLGRDDLAALTLDERRARHDELDEVIAGWTRTQRPQVAMETLQAAGVAAGRVLDTGSVHDDLHLLHRDFWVYLPHPQMIRYKQQGVTWRLVEAEPVPGRHAPFFGEHNTEILAELGLSAEDLSSLAKRAVIADAPINPGVG